MNRISGAALVWSALLLAQSVVIGWLLVRFARRRTEARLQAECAARAHDLAAKLISIQEAERTRIARELHDDATHRIAALSVGLNRVKHVLRDPELRVELARLEDHSMALGDQLRHFSRELHPGLLQRAGLIAALHEGLAEFSRRHGVDVDFKAEDVEAVPSQAALCLYRVAQEALHNIGQHAQASRVHVALAHTPRELHLTIADDGRGFDPAVRVTGSGLGLIGLDERVRLLNGTLTVDTSPNQGTIVSARLPVGGGRYASH